MIAPQHAVVSSANHLPLSFPHIFSFYLRIISLPYEYISLSQCWRERALEDRQSRNNHLYSYRFTIHTARPSSPAENPRKRPCLSVLCPKKLKVDCLNNKVVILLIIYVFDAKVKPAVLQSDLFVSRRFPSYTLDSTLSNRLLGQQ